ncbi:MAG: SWIM zinc finger family protein, partial [Blastocatellia bacterium]|nr:SWIM zinc finger family protein [Blastocatellia bacterium]
MEFNYSYKGSSAVTSHSSQTKMSFSPDTKREPTFFIGELQKNIEFREAISALHNVVVSDLRFKPKDKTAYKAWAAERDKIDVQMLAAQRTDLVEQIKGLQTELNQIY